MDKDQTPKMNWNFLIAWVAATTLGWTFGMVTEIIVLVGPLIGVAQWLVLRKEVGGAQRWVSATSWGWLLAWLLLNFIQPGQIDLFSGLVFGAGVGIAQWWVLRDWFDGAWWWIPLSIVAWGAGFFALLGEFFVGLVVGVATGIPLEFWLRFGLKIAEDEDY